MRDERDPADRLESIVITALDIDEAAREDYLDRACEGDPLLRREVESLLAFEDRAGEFLAGADRTTRVFREALRAEAAAHTDPLIGRDVGPWRLIERIGEGGMGRVYRAERADDTFEQEVAIKLIRADAATDDVMRRFDRERRLLAQLEHPSIARLIDGGSVRLADGTTLPFLAMEYVDGMRIDAYCDAERLTVRERIELFLTVCDAVQHAHKNLIIHRDLKPSNVLVMSEQSGGRGARTKLLDFGIASVVDQAAAADECDLTTTAERRLTPAYAAPEVTRGGTMTTATDVFSLGVMLFELVSGVRWRSATGDDQPPARLRDALTSVDPAAEQAIGRARSTHSASLLKLLKSDLDVIVSKCLREEPGRRYESVASLSEDLRAYLDGLPVSARPDTRRYRAGRFVARHRFGVSLGAVATLALVAATIVSGIAMMSARSAQRLAESETINAETLNVYLEDLIASIDSDAARGRDLTFFREVLDDTSHRIDSDAALSPRIRASLLSTIGRAYHAIGQYGSARVHLERCAAIQRQQDPRPDTELAVVLGQLGLTRRELGDYDGAIAVYREALTIWTQEPDENGKAIGWLLGAIGDAYWTSGDYQQGEAWMVQSMEKLRRVDGEAAERALAFTVGKLGSLYTDQHRLIEAEPLVFEARDIISRYIDDDDPAMAQHERRIGWLHRRAGRLELSEEAYRRALEISERNLPPDHPTIGYVCNSLASVVEEQGRLEEARGLYVRALEITTDELGFDHVEYGTLCNNIGALLRRLGLHDDAIAYLNEAIRVYEHTHGPDHIWTSFPLTHLAHVYEEQADVKRGLDVIERAVAIRSGAGARTSLLCRAQSVHAGLQILAERFQEAEAILLECAEFEAGESAKSLPHTDTVTRLIRLYDLQGRPDDAASWRDVALAIADG